LLIAGVENIVDISTSGPRNILSCQKEKGKKGKEKKEKRKEG